LRRSGEILAVIRTRRFTVPRSVLDAIRQGIWNFEPGDQEKPETPPTTALPGSREKLDILADRLRQGLPLWHPSDRLSFDDAADE
jgi:hypothetical protein